LDSGISTRRGVMCAHRERALPPQSWRCTQPSVLRESESAQDHGVILPLFHDLTEAEQDRVVAAIREFSEAEQARAGHGDTTRMAKVR
jgi:perosamine synthetase